MIVSLRRQALKSAEERVLSVASAADGVSLLCSAGQAAN